MKRGYVIVPVVGLALAGVFGFAMFRDKMIANYLQNMPEPVLTVETVKAESLPWTRAIAATGRLEAVNGVDLAVEVEGRVREVSYVSGQHVEKGQVLARLDAETERAQLQAARAQVRLDRLTADRYRSLRRTDAASQAKLDEAEANLAIAESEVSRLERVIDKKDIKAPFAGSLGINRLDIGQYVSAGTRVTTLQNLSAMLMDLSVSQRDLPDLAIGAPVEIVVDSYPDRVFKGELTAIEPKVDTQSGLIALQAAFPNDERLLRPGMYAKARIIRPAIDGQVVVPQVAVNYSLYGDFVYVVAADDKGELRARQTVVKVFDRHGNRAAIAEGLKPGETIVSSGAVKLSNGSKVKASETRILEDKPAIGLD